MYTYTPRGVCPRAINIELDGDIVSHVDFEGGCNGNLKAISKVVEGMTVDEVAELFEGNTCGRKPTSCVDQLVKGLRLAQNA
ncbi:TIGR03905 family TSCPD domain-containing protein [Raoultibacter timonensis]|uniref:ribonucleoside-diphosphate reductase n=1 Tax=Raoultibacter timonensis TaxID=1907662 RepID=A0ABM7WJC4_9ACTN|nr:TIGR03905 family TSCPD domain-containing protein [Raoultibacter timonensis]BDE96407.1 TSCPD domain-containing protein [Raoultibacter timonensis]BDF51011.1 TSCPD domain-containing protein [Raoultibacter timonensis]